MKTTKLFLALTVCLTITGYSVFADELATTVVLPTSADSAPAVTAADLATANAEIVDTASAVQSSAVAATESVATVPVKNESTSAPATASATTESKSSDLNSQLNDLKIPQNVAPEGVSSEKLYSVQNRFVELKKRFEVNLGVSKNFTGDGMLSMNQINAAVTYHIDNRWSVTGSGSYGFNDFTQYAKLLMATQKPDVAVVKWRSDLLLGYNLFYGKFRMSMDEVFYFDQYVSAGPGIVTTQFGTVPAGVVDVGFALWFGKNWSARVGAKNDFFNEKKILSEDLAYHLLGHIEIGYLLGGEDRSYE